MARTWLAKHAIDPEKFEDHYEDALRAMIHDKQKGHRIVRPSAPKAEKVVDLMDALRASLKDSAPTPRRAAAASRSATRHRAPAKKPRAKRA